MQDKLCINFYKPQQLQRSLAGSGRRGMKGIWREGQENICTDVGTLWEKLCFSSDLVETWGTCCCHSSVGCSSCFRCRCLIPFNPPQQIVSVATMTNALSCFNATDLRACLSAWKSPFVFVRVREKMRKMQPVVPQFRKFGNHQTHQQFALRGLLSAAGCFSLLKLQRSY